MIRPRETAGCVDGSALGRGFGNVLTRGGADALHRLCPGLTCSRPLRGGPRFREAASAEGQKKFRQDEQDKTGWAALPVVAGLSVLKRL